MSSPQEAKLHFLDYWRIIRIRKLIIMAVFFSTIEECVEKIRRYLPDQSARRRIAAAGRARAERSGYHNDRQVGLIVERARNIVASA